MKVPVNGSCEKQLAPNAFFLQQLADSPRVNSSRRQMQQCRNRNSNERRLGDHFSAMGGIQPQQYEITAICLKQLPKWDPVSAVSKNSSYWRIKMNMNYISPPPSDMV